MNQTKEHALNMGLVKTLTKRQLLEALENLSDNARIEFTLCASELEKAKINGLTIEGDSIHHQYILGLPGDAGIDEKAIAFMLWAKTE